MPVTAKRTYRRVAESPAQERDSALQKAQRAQAKLREFKNSAPGQVLTWGAGGVIAGAVLDKKMDPIGGKVAPSAAGAVLLGMYAYSKDDIGYAAAALGMGSSTLQDLGEKLADWLPFGS